MAKKFVNDLRYLFEDPELDLVFDAVELKFRIRQPGKKEFTFQTLSSGYSAIFDIYANLIIRTEYFEITPEQLTGVVFIDEIDVHLHVSLQRKILPFFARSFPNIQFIATTHSPFVVTSAFDTLIYDLNTGQQSDNLSMYSVETVVEGLLGVSPVSEQLQDKIKKLVNLTSNDSFNMYEAQTILSYLEPYSETLDAESRMFYEIALNKTIKQRSTEI
ncbi:hypothetical protein BVY11_27715 [Pseudomonas amygdali pv. morsprunorum]|nr:hypothetical protein BVY11_27715 [Pseudomonas amygdali pv. morsprunorum]PPS25907.1 hypothetical protein BVY12_28530 [Pseudomonas amygdali pv. morsprunorum]